MTLLLPLLVALSTPPWDLVEMRRLEAEVFVRGDTEADHAPAFSFSSPPEVTTAGLHQEAAAPAPSPADLGLDGLIIPVTLNAAVRAYIDFFQNRGRPIYARWLARMGLWAPHMLPILEKQGLPPELIYVCMIESGFSTRAVSHASAVGPWQFIRRTGAAYGLKMDSWVDERRDPIKATQAAARYFKDLHDKFGSWPLVMAAYNAGDGAVRRGVRRANSNDFWRLIDADTLPEQAQRYVPKAMAAMIIGQDPERYGFGAVRPEPRVTFAVASVPGKLELRGFARRARIPYDVLAGLNPELNKAVTPPGNDYGLRVPSDALARAQTAVRAKARMLVEHRVRFGERVRHIASDYGVNRRTLRRLNDLRRGIEPKPGDVLVVPRPDGPPTGAEEFLVLTEPGVDFEIEDRQEVFVPIRWSRPVDEVAAFFQISPGDLAMWNALDPAAPLQSGMALRLYLSKDFDTRTAVTVPRSAVSTAPAGSPEALAKLDKARTAPIDRQLYTRYTVKRGDNLWKIARKHKVPVKVLREENTLRRGQRMKLGQTLRIPIPKKTRRGTRPKKMPRATAARAPKPKPTRARPVRVKPARPEVTRPVRRPKGRGMRYTVRKGDNLYKVADRYDVSPRSLRERNGLPKGVRLRAGQVLYIP